MPTTLQEFTSHSIWPYVSIYLAYAVFKYVALGIALVIFFISWKNSKKVQKLPEKPPIPFIHKHAHKLVLHTFGRSPEKLTISNAESGNTNNNTDQEHGVYFLGGKKLDDEHVMILVVHGICVISIGIFVILKMFWINVITHTCSTGRNIHCFPQILNENDTHLVPNISLNARTNDCSQWTHESFVDRITFICFEFTYSIEGAIVALGGVLSLFTPTMNVIIFVAHNLYKLANKCGNCHCILYWFQLILGIIGLLIELFLVILVLVTSGMATHVSGVDEFFMNTVAEQIAMFFMSHGIVILFIFGIVNTSLLMPWDKYVNEENQET